MPEQSVLELCRMLKERYAPEGVEILGIFGSYARGEQTPESDVDIAYRLDENRFFTRYKGFAAAARIGEIAGEVEEALHKKVDFVSVNSMNKRLSKNIYKDLAYA